MKTYKTASSFPEIWTPTPKNLLTHCDTHLRPFSPCWGPPGPRLPFFRTYAAQDRKEIGTLAEWDARENGSRVFAPWRPFHHPQLGEVEMGGIDPLRGIMNPPEK
jgi:hypothetical protein